MDTIEAANAKKRLFDGEWRRTSETGFSKFMRFNGVAYLLSFPLAAKGSNMRLRLSEDLQSISAESTGIPANPRAEFNLVGEKVAIDNNGRICMDSFFWDTREGGKLLLITTREDYNRTDNEKFDVVITRTISDEDPNTMVSRLVATKKGTGSQEECVLVFTRNTGSSLF